LPGSRGAAIYLRKSSKILTVLIIKTITDANLGG